MNKEVSHFIGILFARRLVRLTPTARNPFQFFFKIIIDDPLLVLGLNCVAILHTYSNLFKISNN